MHVLASIPSPTHSIWHLGPLPIRAYALCIIVGILEAVWLATRRWVRRGGNPDHVWDVAAWAIVLGIIGARLYHLATDPELYFEGRPGTSPVNAFKIWDGGLGIWGAIALGFAGAWIGCRRRRIRIAVFADCAIPGIVFAQAIGRLGNWFNNELYGRATSLPWGLQIHDIDVDRGHTQACGFGHIGAQVCGTYQPTFLYELIWDAAVGFALLYLDRRFRLGRGNVMALYVMGYTVGRAWIEYLRIDTANHFLGLRINDWTCLVVFLGGLAWFLTHGGFRDQREASPYYDVAPADPKASSETPELPEAPEKEEVGSMANPIADLPELPDLEVHHDHHDVSGGWLRPTVFGMMDGLVSNFALIAGIAGASSSSTEVALAGLAGLVGGAFSMATGEYVSVMSQNESTAAEVEIERHEIVHNAAAEQHELAEMYIARGVDADVAQVVAEQLSRDPDQALLIHAQEELGVDPKQLPSPWTAAGSSLASFAVGAFIPLAPYLFGASALWIAALLAMVALFVAGALTARFTARCWWFAGLRQLLLGVLAAAVTYGVGSLFGAAVG